MKIGAAFLLLLMLTACAPTAEELAAEQLQDDIEHWEAMGYELQDAIRKGEINLRFIP